MSTCHFIVYIFILIGSDCKFSSEGLPHWLFQGNNKNEWGTVCDVSVVGLNVSFVTMGLNVSFVTMGYSPLIYVLVH